MQVKSYLRPTTEAELYRTLERENAPVLFVAGATDLLVQARKDEPFQNHAAYDLTALSALREIWDGGDAIWIGGTATHTDVATAPIVRAHAPVLAAAAAVIGAVQLRNRATIGGPPVIHKALLPC